MHLCKIWDIFTEKKYHFIGSTSCMARIYPDFRDAHLVSWLTQLGAAVSSTPVILEKYFDGMYIYLRVITSQESIQIKPIHHCAHCAECRESTMGCAGQRGEHKAERRT